MQPFAYTAPTTVKEAVEILTKHGNKARPLAGGTDLLVQIRGGRFNLDAVVDIKKIPELNNLSNDSNSLNIGAAVPCHRIYEDPKISEDFPGLIDAAELIGGIQIQSRAGFGGNLCREDNVTEKLDGQNIMISWKDGKLIAARNKGHIKNGGATALDAKGISGKFAGRG